MEKLVAMGLEAGGVGGDLGLVAIATTRFTGPRLKKALHDAVLEGMETDNGEPTARL